LKINGPKPDNGSNVGEGGPATTGKAAESPHASRTFFNKAFIAHLDVEIVGELYAKSKPAFTPPR
jgi:hypothetical protein